ncbi:virulence plasmid 28 protein [Pseudomonas granadensis]|uniref:Virulence plasmid 28 protein n=1 Tax=Pseudomonas granadensis TaxID=1421430 RepID=A0ABX7GCT7_9PSED|nr:Tc toxin subunit A [Pseudomonas granadensis]QRK83188.1 virulence plasmid 28 protein [Pseudomonas granadensis]
MNAPHDSPVQQLVKAVLGERQVPAVSPLDEYLAQNPSVFDLIKLGVVGLRKLGLSREESRVLMARGNAMALYVARLFREYSLRAAPRLDEVEALVPLPTYMEQFKPDINGAAAQGSPEHRASTTAYVVALREWVRDYIVPHGDKSQAIALGERRPDVDELLIDDMAINRVQSRLEIVNSVLEAQILERTNKTWPTIKAYLRTIRFHNGLPYDHDWQSIAHVADKAIKDGRLGDVIRRVDLDYPYFKNPGGRGARADVALQLSIGIGPLQLALLLEDPYFPLNAAMAEAPLRRVDPQTRLVDPDPEKSSGSFYKDNFGELGSTLESVRSLWIFKNATRLDQGQVDCLLGLGAFTPKLSPNVTIGDTSVPATGVDAGARYIHGGQAPAITLLKDGTDDLFRLHNVGEVSPEDLQHRMDRINRKCRLDRMLQLPSYQVDQLLMAAMEAERRGTGDSSIWIRANTLRCLGLFKELNSAYDCKAEEFAALIDVLSVYGQDGQLSHFDRVYSRASGFNDPVQIDDAEFAIVPRTQAEQQIVHQICGALEINFETYRYLATVIAGAYGLNTHLKRSLAILSSFWRLVRLARMFGLTPVESIALLRTLSEGEGLVAQLAGEPAISGQGSTDGADALSAIRGLMGCANWCRKHDLPPMWLVQNVNPVYVPTVWSESQEQFLRQLRSQIISVRVEQATLLEEGAPLRDGKEALIDWLSRLSPLVDSHGLVIGQADETQEQSLARITAVIEALLKELFPLEGAPFLEPLLDLIRTIVLRCRDEQRVAVEERLSVYLKLDSLLVAQVLAWAQGHPYDFVKEAMSLPPLGVARERQVLDRPDSFLQMLTELERRGRIAEKLELSPAMLATLLTGEQYQWFSLENPYEISVRSVYYLAFYRHMITQARQPEEKMLDYLLQVNQLPDDMSEDALRLTRDAAADKLARFFGCGIRHVLECVEHLNREVESSDIQPLPVLRNLAQLDLLERTLELARNGMDASAAFELGALYPLDTESVYASAAQNALESLARFNTVRTPQESAEVGQSFTSRCVVDNPTLIANVPQEVAEFEITLLDFYGEPLKGVDLHIGTDLGAVLTPVIRTDEKGRAWAQLQAGARMGTAHLHYNVPLYKSVYGPSVVIDCEEASLKFNSELSSLLPDDPVLAGRLWEQEVYTKLVDDYGNPGAHRQVAWSTTLGEIRPSETFTDKEGRSRVWISSLSDGDAKIAVARVEGGHSMEFNGAIKFDDIPRIFAAPAVTTVALSGHELQLQCRVVGLDDLPREGESVQWWTSAEPAKIPVPSDVDGISRFSVANPSEDNLTVYAQLGTAPRVEVSLWVASAAVIQNFSQVIRFPVAGATRPTLLWVDVKEASSEGARPVANYPVTWTRPSTEPETIATDAQGRSVYPFKSSNVGEVEVTATLSLDTAIDKKFKLTVIKAFAWKVELITIAGKMEIPETIIPGTDELTLFRDGEYRLEISPVDGASLLGSDGAFGWSSDYSFQALGMVFSPPLATRSEFTAEPFWVNIQTANIRNGRFQLSLFCDRLNEALVLEGTLGKRPVTRLPSSTS